MDSYHIHAAQMPLVAALKTAAERRGAPFHTPGHRQGKGIARALGDWWGQAVFQADLPELPELDNLFAPQGAIAAAQALAAQTFGAEQTDFLVNGSTSGVIAAILATCNPGEKIILPRTVHQSAISGLILSGAIPIFLAPEYDAVRDIAHSITPTAVAAALTQHPDAKAVLLVSPTYYGVCGDVAAIADLAHQHNIPLLVDEAHGAHFAFHTHLPTPALLAGADLAVQSIHKTLAAMTQAAMIHRRGNRVQDDRLRKALALVQSTSPSYLLLASLDAARQQMATQGASLMQRALDLAESARSRLRQIYGLAVLETDSANTPGFVALDRTRLTVTVSGLGLDGFTADELLHKTWGITAELPSLQHLTFIITPGNTEEDIERLVEAFQQLAQASHSHVLKAGKPNTISKEIRSAALTSQNANFSTPTERPLTLRDAFFSPSETIPIAQTLGRMSAELVCPYPPGIPVLMPGEVISPAAIAYLQQICIAGGMISGCADPTLETLRVILA